MNLPSRTAPVPAGTLSYVEMVLQRHIDNPPDPPDGDFPNINDEGEYKHRYWDMVRELKDDRYMASLPGYFALPILQRVIGDLRALGYESADEATDDLEPLWDKVKLGATEGPLDAAARMAERYPVRFRTNRLSKAYQRFLNIAYQLQVMRGGDNIALPVARLAEILGVSPMHVSRFREYAKDDGFLREVKRAHHLSRQATIFKFVGCSWS